uniref:Uncharacterized protein n=1 Tax=Cacopsylla melanoneura TaxID=428564 RepID=A0A8D8QDV2_9HEMI
MNSVKSAFFKNSSRIIDLKFFFSPFSIKNELFSYLVTKFFICEFSIFGAIFKPRTFTQYSSLCLSFFKFPIFFPPKFIIFVLDSVPAMWIAAKGRGKLVAYNSDSQGTQYGVL